VENGRVNFQTMRLTLIANLVAAVLLGVLLWVAVPAAIGRPLRLWEALVLAAGALALLVLWRGRRLRREREQTESLRDSALW
jgi:membrane protein implicated in regulation of membrane protease activity